MPLLRVPIGVDGPVVDLGIWIGRAAAHLQIAQGQAVAPFQTVLALIDTGASRTAIHPHALALIGSRPVGTTRIRRASTPPASLRVDLHDVRLVFGGVSTSAPRATWVEITAAAVAPANPSILALIGRDMLAHCQFVYDGLNGELLLVF
jgi:predicted aspartyl protease